MLATLWTAVRSRAVGALAVLATAAALLTAAYSKGRQDAAARQAQQRLQSVKKARNVEQEVGRLGPADIDAGIARWLRDR